jgi:8-oxo-dGTP pyrophosphatase MutT (NUDIX family)
VAQSPTTPFEIVGFERPVWSSVRDESERTLSLAGHAALMEPALERPSGRIIAVDPQGCVLLFRIEDPEDTKPPIWITPGGGIEAGESPAEAAVREFQEETGVAIDIASVGTPVAVTRGEWAFRGQRLYSVDWFFAWRGPRFEPSTTGWSELEHQLHAEWRWWEPGQIRISNEAVLPADLADVAERVASGDISEAPIELPWIVPE